jgi:hypothetical protein
MSATDCPVSPQAKFRVDTPSQPVQQSLEVLPDSAVIARFSNMVETVSDWGARVNW